MNAADASRKKLLSLLGDLPDSRQIVRSELLEKETRTQFILEKLKLELNGLEPVPALFLKPHGKGPFSAVLYNHSHGGFYDLGKRELLDGAPYLFQASYAEALTRQGYAVLAIDHWAFGERSHHKEESLFKEMLWKGQVMWGMMVFDSLRALDYLASREDVQKDRLATLGMSMGSTMAWWVAALDTRIKACVDLCCLTDFEALIETGGLDLHGSYYYVPALLKHFTTAGINQLITPRAHLALAGKRDGLTPVQGLAKIDAVLSKAYLEAGCPEKWKLHLSEEGHLETEAMRAEAMSFLKRWL